MVFFWGEDKRGSGELRAGVRGARDSLARMRLRFREHMIDLVRGNASYRSSQAGIHFFRAQRLQSGRNKIPQPVTIHRSKRKHLAICDVGLSKWLAHRLLTLDGDGKMIEGATSAELEHDDSRKIFSTSRSAKGTPSQSHTAVGENSVHFYLHFSN